MGTTKPRHVCLYQGKILVPGALALPFHLPVVSLTMEKRTKKIRKKRAHPELNWRPADLQSAALPLSYTPDSKREIP